MAYTSNNITTRKFDVVIACTYWWHVSARTWP